MLAVGIVRTFLISSVSVVVVALVLIGIAFWRISKRPKTGVSDRANAGRVAVVEFGITEPSTKAAVAALAPITADKFTTVVFTRDNINEWLSVRNIPTVHPIFVDQLNTYDVITSQYVVFTKEAFEAFVAAKTEPKEA